MKNYKILVLTFTLALLSSCGSEEIQFDASGSFEAEQTIISSEVAGALLKFDLEEGQTISKGQLIGYIDSMQLFLKKKQLEEQIQSMLGKRPNVSLQLAALETQLTTAESERNRVQRMVDENATAKKRLDDLNAQIEIVKNQIAALKSTLTITSEGITNDANLMSIQIEQIDDQLKKCRLVSPMTGTVLTTYTRENEMAAPGKPLYKVANLSTMYLRVYITGNQLAQVKLNQKVKVFTDNGNDGYNETSGVISWISNKGEFTPKTIQTKDERANMVYAIKVKVQNDGKFKIGMYGEIKF